MIENPCKTYCRIDAPPRITLGLSIIGLVLFMAAFGLRCYHPTQAPLDFHPGRQLRSFLLVRAYYFENAGSIPRWQQQVAQFNRQMIPIKEPPIMEHLVATAYRLVGAEEIWIPRMFSVTFWVLGGLFLYMLTSKMTSPPGALVSTAFYLFAPFGIFISRSFQPDAMMVMLFIAGIGTIWRYYNRPSMMRLLVAAGVAVLAILVKFIAVFPIVAAFLFVGVAKEGLHKGLFNIRRLLFLLASGLLGTGYYFYMTFGPGRLGRVADTIFLPHLLLETSFWAGWLQVVGRIVGYPAVIAGLIGIALFKNRSDKALLTGLWAGYIIYALLFTYTTATHDYYQVLLLPIVALSLGPIGSIIVARLRHPGRVWCWGLAVLGLLVMTGAIHAGLNIRHDQFRKLDPVVKSRLEILCNFIGLNPHYLKQINNDFREEITAWREIGEAVNHSTRTILLSQAYGHPLRYYGQLFGANWPRQKDLEVRKSRRLEALDVQAHFEKLIRKWSPEYFIVTDLEDFAGQNDLKDLLTNKFPVIARSDKYLIFDLTEEIGPKRPNNSGSADGGSAR